MSFKHLSALCLLFSTCVGCATTTGIPSHGGGKRFFIEQELISASARAATQCIDVESLRGKPCAMFLTTVGDQGAGNLVGGKYQWQSALRGDCVSSATQATRNFTSPQNSLTETRDGTGLLQQSIAAAAPTIYPFLSESQTEGGDFRVGGGAGMNGFGDYSALGFLNDDTGFLGAVLREALVLKGVLLVPPERAENFIYVTVDAFGTNRNRTEMHVYNEERLQAKTAVHVTAFDRKGNVVVPTQTSSWEADYRERYVFWCGPFEVEKRVYQSDDLLVSFRGLSDEAQARGYADEASGDLKAEEVAPGEATLDLDADQDRTGFPTRQFESSRPGDIIRDLSRPDPTRPEDVNRYREGGLNPSR